MHSSGVSTSPWIRSESRRPYCSSHSSFRQVRGYGQSPVARTVRVILRFDKSVDTVRVPSPVLFESFFVSTSPWIRLESRRPYCSSHSSFRQVRGYSQSPVARTVRVILRFDKSVDTARVPSPVLFESLFVSTSPWIRSESRRPYCSSHSSFRQVRGYGQSPVARTARVILRFDKSVDTVRVTSPVLLESFFVSTSPWIRSESRRPYCSSHSSFRQVRGYGQSPVARTVRVTLRFDKSVDTVRVPSPVLLESLFVSTSPWIRSESRRPYCSSHSSFRQVRGYGQSPVACTARVGPAEMSGLF